MALEKGETSGTVSINGRVITEVLPEVAYRLKDNKSSNKFISNETVWAEDHEWSIINTTSAEYMGSRMYESRFQPYLVVKLPDNIDFDEGLNEIRQIQDWIGCKLLVDR